MYKNRNRKFNELINELENLYLDKLNYYIDTLNKFNILKFDNQNPYNQELNNYIFITYKQNEDINLRYEISLNSLSHPQSNPNDNGYIFGVRLSLPAYTWLINNKDGITYIKWFENHYDLQFDKKFIRKNYELKDKYNKELREYITNTYNIDLLYAIDTYIFRNIVDILYNTPLNPIN